MGDDYQLSREQMERMRTVSISQNTRIFYGVQGEASRWMRDHVATRGRVWVPDQYWVRAGMLPPSWWRGRFSGETVADDNTCPECGEPADCRTYLPDRGERYWHHDHEPRTAPDLEAACIEEVAA